MGLCYRMDGVGKFWALIWLLALSSVFSLSGCTPPPPPEGQLAIENVAKWYQLYRAEHRGKVPPDEEEFMEFINARLGERGITVTAEELFTSPRDGEKYVIQYGDLANSTNMERNIACYEKTGYDGKKLVGFEAAWAREVDETELQALLQVK